MKISRVDLIKVEWNPDIWGTGKFWGLILRGGEYSGLDYYIIDVSVDINHKTRVLKMSVGTKKKAVWPLTWKKVPDSRHPKSLKGQINSWRMSIGQTIPEWIVAQVVGGDK